MPSDHRLPHSSLRSRCSLWAAGLVALALPAFPPQAHADPFHQANLLYEQGHFQEAAAAYRALLHTGQVSAPLHFNLANACFQLGQLGQAIAHFRLAQYLDPRDADIHANLQFARQQAATTDSVLPHPLERQLQKLTLNEWTLLTATAFWLLLALLTLGQLYPALVPRLRLWTRVTFLTAATLAATTATAWSYLRPQTQAIVIQPKIEIRFGPVNASAVRFTATDGTELRVTDQIDDWVQITDAARRTGWAQRADLFLLP